LLAPYYEALHFLFYMDARTRYEGVDLWYRIEQDFPVRSERMDTASTLSKAGAILLAVGTLFLSAVPACAQSTAKLEPVKKARQQVAAIKDKAETANPYPGGKTWAQQLRRVGSQLDPDGHEQAGRYKWLFQAADKLGTGNRTSDMKILGDVEDQLTVIEKSLT